MLKAVMRICVFQDVRSDNSFGPVSVIKILGESVHEFQILGFWLITQGILIFGIIE